jgi:hypothetical protein
MAQGGKNQKRASRRHGIFIGAWVPKSVAAAVDEAIQTSKLGRSKFLRQALEEKVKRESN